MSPIGSSPVDEIKSKLDIVEVVSEYVQLKRGGVNWKARCPFHQEKTPSFTVNRDRQIFHCFGCGKGGDIFTFVQEIEGLEFPDALRLLAKKAGVRLKVYDPKLQTRKTKLLDLTRAAAIHFFELLVKSPEGKAARDYLKERGVSDDMVKAFGLGYSANRWDELIHHLKPQGFTDVDLLEAGLTVKREDGSGFYDRFRGRLIFSIKDVHGNVVGFAGRVLEAVTGTADSGAKYINTPETLIYKKGSIIYGLDRAKQAIREAKRAVLVEGYMDCLASHQAGVENVVATSGTALTRDQLTLLKRYTTTLLLAFDTDVAGEDASKRGIDLALAEEFAIKVVTLPSGKDPDELIRSDRSAWVAALGSAQSIMEYYFTKTFAKHDATTVEGKKAIAKTLLPVIGRLGDPVEQTHYLQQLGAALRVDEQTLRSRLPRMSGSTVPAAEIVEERRPSERGKRLAERVLSLSLGDSERFGEVLRELEPWMVPDQSLARLYKTAVLFYTERRELNREAFRQHLQKDDPSLVATLDYLEMLADREFGEADPPTRVAEVRTALAALKRAAVAQELKKVTEDIRVAERERDQRKLEQLTERFQQLTAALH